MHDDGGFKYLFFKLNKYIYFTLIFLMLAKILLISIYPLFPFRTASLHIILLCVKAIVFKFMFIGLFKHKFFCLSSFKVGFRIILRWKSVSPQFLPHGYLYSFLRVQSCRLKETDLTDQMVNNNKYKLLNVRVFDWINLIKKLCQKENICTLEFRWRKT